MIGDEAELYRMLSPRVLQVVGQRVRTSPENVEDACHFAWVAFLRRSDAVARGAALAWVTTTAVHEAYKLVKRQQRARSLDQVLDTALEPVASGRGPPDRAAESEQLRLLRELPERQQRILLLQAAGFSHAEISQHTGDTERTVQRQLGRARRTLTRLQRSGAIPHDTTTIPRPAPPWGPRPPSTTL